MQEAIERPDTDVVVVALPNFLHAESISMIAQAGKAADFGDMYITSTPRLETGDERYQWLNDFVYVAEGKADMLQEDG